MTVTGDVEEGLPSWQLPWKFNLETTNSSTTSGPIEMAEDFGIGLLMLPLVSMLQHLAIAKFYTRKCLYSASASIALELKNFEHKNDS